MNGRWIVQHIVYWVGEETLFSGLFIDYMLRQMEMDLLTMQKGSTIMNLLYVL